MTMLDLIECSRCKESFDGDSVGICMVCGEVMCMICMQMTDGTSFHLCSRSCTEEYYKKPAYYDDAHSVEQAMQELEKIMCLKEEYGVEEAVPQCFTCGGVSTWFSGSINGHSVCSNDCMALVEHILYYKEA